MKKKIAVVTGATGGMGNAICRTLNRDGYTIIGQYRNNHDKAESLQHDIRDSGGEFHPIACDLTSPTAPDVLADTVHRIVEKSAGAVHVVVNNAAKLLGPSLATATVDQFDEYFAVNVRAPFFLIQALLPLMPAGGSIVNISSAGAHFSSPGDIVYAMSKAALESLTPNLAEDIAKRGIRINTVVPGFTDNGHEAFKNPAVLEYMSSFAALGGVAQPDVIAHAVSFLASDLSNRTTGTILDVSGGSTIGVRNRTAPSVRHIFETPPTVPVE